MYATVPFYGDRNKTVEIKIIDVHFIEHQCSREYLHHFKAIFNASNGFTSLGRRTKYLGNIDRRLKIRIIYQKEDRQVGEEAIISPSTL